MGLNRCVSNIRMMFCVDKVFGFQINSLETILLANENDFLLFCLSIILYVLVLEDQFGTDVIFLLQPVQSLCDYTD